eukprot:4527288-Alexandrium_andersonii.AAC.1
MPAASTAVSLRWFKVLSQLMLIRFNYTQFTARATPGATEGDPLMAQRVETLCALARAASEPEGIASLGAFGTTVRPFRLRIRA